MDNKRYDDIKPYAATAYWDDFVEAFGPCPAVLLDPLDGLVQGLHL